MNVFFKYMIASAIAISAAPTQAAGTPDYDFNATVLCDAQWFGSRRSNGNHNLHSYYFVIGDKKLGDNGLPQESSTTYVLDFFGDAPADEFNPQPPTGTYTLSSEIAKNTLSEGSCVYILDGNGNYEVDRAFTAGELVISTYQKDDNTYYKYEASVTDEAGKLHHLVYESRFIEYADKSQASMDLEKNLNFRPVEAVASYHSMKDGVMRLSLNVNTFMRDDEGHQIYHPIPGSEMFMELYMPYGKDLANGVYTPSEDYGEAFTMQDGEIITMAGGVQYPVGSYVQYMFEGQQIAWGVVKSGTLTVSGEGTERKLEGEFVTDYGFNIKFTYEGEIKLEDFPQTGLTDNIELDLNGAQATFDCVGDVERLLDCRNWYITILPTEGKDHGFHAYINSRTANFHDGIASTTYTPSPSKEPWCDEYQRGTINDKGQLSGTWMLSGFDDKGQPQVNAPAAKGELIITRHDDGETYTVKFDMNDGAGHDFKGEWTGIPELVNSCEDEEPVSVIGVEADSDVYEIYDLYGRRVNNMHDAGLYVIRKADGRITKVMK